MRFASRKFLLTLLILAVAGALEYLQRLSPGGATLLGSILTAYLASNVSQKAVSK